MNQVICIAYETPGPGSPEYYKLESAVYGLEGGGTQVMYFFARVDINHGVPYGDRLVATLSTDLLPKELVDLTRVLMERMGFNDQEAADIVGGLKGRMKDLDFDARKKVIEEICAALKQD